MLEQIYNFVPLGANLLSSGMPTADQLKDVATSGVHVVINLATPTSENALPDEQGLVESLGMQYIGIPVEWDHPGRKDLDDFMRAMDLHSDSKILVHCQANFRASAFIALYRIQRQGWNRQQAFADVLPIWNPDDYPAWRKFLDKNLGVAPG